MASRVASLKMKANNWSLDVLPGTGADCGDYISAALTNIDNDHHRSRRQWFNLRVQEDETLMGYSGRPLVCPDVVRAAPPVPAGPVAHRPCLWLTAPQVVSTLKRGREPSSEYSDVQSDRPEAKRRLVWKCAGALVGQPLFLGTHQSKPPPGLPILCGIIWR